VPNFQVPASFGTNFVLPRSAIKGESMHKTKMFLSATAALLALSGGLALSGVAPASAAKMDKVTICHYTGSESNPYVAITISGNAQGKHESNHVPEVHQGSDGLYNPDAECDAPEEDLD
jgi:ABC-type sugar transport system substrate-binding protein